MLDDHRRPLTLSAAGPPQEAGGVRVHSPCAVPPVQVPRPLECGQEWLGLPRQPGMGLGVSAESVLWGRVWEKAGQGSAAHWALGLAWAAGGQRRGCAGRSPPCLASHLVMRAVLSGGQFQAHSPPVRLFPWWGPGLCLPWGPSCPALPLQQSPSVPLALSAAPLPLRAVAHPTALGSP